jgi:CheY-like chemotaxis protein/CHASE3 domain sensor protein
MPLLSRKLVLTLAFAIALGIFASIGFLSYFNMAAVRDSDSWVNHTYSEIHQFDLLLTELVDAETGERGFIITGNEGYLTPYHNALRRIAATRTAVRELTRENPAQQKRLDMLDPLIDKKLAQLKETVEVRRWNGANAAAEMVVTHLSNSIMEEIRKLVAEAQTDEERLLKVRTAKKRLDMSDTIDALKTGGVVGFTLLLVVFYLLNKEIGQRSAAEAVLTSRNEELKRNQELQQSQNWIKTGLNELNLQVRGERSVQSLAADALTFLSRYLRAGVGALYLHDETTSTLNITANFAFTRGRGLNETILIGEGIAGEAAREKKLIALEEVPPGYITVKSALGETAPRSVVALPLLHDDALVGVMELGSLKPFEPHQLDLLTQAAEVIAVAIAVNLGRQRVTELLLQSQSQEEELRVQQEELQQSNEELEERAQLLEQQREQIQVKNREMEEAGLEIVRKAKEVEQVSSYKSEFLANMSHELRTPLNSLMILSGHLQENREGNLSPKQVEYAATIKSAGTELLNLINDILDLSKIESGRLEFVYEEASLAELVEQLSATFKPLADQKGLFFSTEIEEGAPSRLKLDMQRTLQILKNLISNAVKFTQQGGVTLRIYLPKLAESPLTSGALAFSVTDTGIGIPAAKRELIFQAFQQADGSTSRKFGGTGLGLSISRQLARGMQGEVLVAGAEGEGSVFTLYLPLVPSAAQAGAAAAEGKAPAAIAARPRPAPSAPSAPAASLKDDRDTLAPGERSILIIEDDATFAGLLMDRVRERGFAALLAHDGNSGIELARSFLPSAVLLDVMLPGLDGWGVMQRLTDDPRIRHIPVHFITCMEEKQKALSMGAIGFVTKPVSSEQLDAVLGAVEDAVSRTVRKLLIVEDDKAQATALVALLDERGVAITVAETGAEAVRLLSGEPFDCIVLDLGLADMSGFELLEHIRNLEESRRIPVIIHTGKELSEEDTLRLQQYAESIIIKGAKSPERLLNEVTLFLHVMESRLRPEKQRMIRTALDTETLLAGKKVLLVDDDMRNIFSLSSVLVEKGMRVVEAENGKVALARLEEQPDINIVLMDVMMPEMDGYEATRRIRKDPRFSGLPVIALTAKAMKGDREACLKAGASDYITKPVDMERLLSLLRVWLYNQG